MCSLKVLEPLGSPTQSLLQLLAERECSLRYLRGCLHRMGHTQACQLLNCAGRDAVTWGLGGSAGGKWGGEGLILLVEWQWGGEMGWDGCSGVGGVGLDWMNAAWWMGWNGMRRVQLGGWDGMGWNEMG